jgi:hypothetical protein
VLNKKKKGKKAFESRLAIYSEIYSFRLGLESEEEEEPFSSLLCMITNYIIFSF